MTRVEIMERQGEAMTAFSNAADRLQNALTMATEAMSDLTAASAELSGLNLEDAEDVSEV